jgi:hypothetical protein
MSEATLSSLRRPAAIPRAASPTVGSEAVRADPNPLWSRLSWLGAQAKLRVGAIDDPAEVEADRVADQVMRMPQPVVQRQCDRCAAGNDEAVALKSRPDEEPSTIRRLPSANDGAQDADGELPADFSRRLGVGEPLDAASRTFFEARLGVRLDPVRIHADADADAAAARVRARAFTLGRDVVFAAGEHDAHSDRGRRLMAHELAHVVQQGGSLPWSGGARGRPAMGPSGDADAPRAAPSAALRRAPLDFAVRDLDPDHAGDRSRIFFPVGQSSIPAGAAADPGSEASKIAAFATPVADPLTLHGYASEEGPAAVNAMLASQRIAAVDRALQRAGHRGVRTPAPHPTDSIGAIDYRNRRAVEIARPPVGSVGAIAPAATPTCGPPGSENASGTALTDCQTAVAAVAPAAVAIADIAEADVVTTPTATAAAEVATLFPGVPRADVDANLVNIAAQVRRVATQFLCASDCHDSCTRPASNLGQAAAARIVLCPSWVASGADFQTYVFIHEAAHGSAGPATIDDIGYDSSRLVRVLTPGDSVRNTDSYTLLIRRVHAAHTGGAAPRIGPATLDTVTGAGSPADQTAVLTGVAWLEAWLNYGSFDTGLAYGAIHRAVSGGAWPAPSVPPTREDDQLDFDRGTLHELALAFPGQLTDPHDAAPFVLPTARDRERMAAIHDRFSQMYATVDSRALTIVVSAAAPEGWHAQARIPRLQPSLTVAPAYLGLAAPDQVLYLVRLMARARSDISAPFVAFYADGLDRIRHRRGLGPT